jgi:hypothetical protein
MEHRRNRRSVDKLCTVCGEQRGHVVAHQRALLSRVLSVAREAPSKTGSRPHSHKPVLNVFHMTGHVLTAKALMQHPTSIGEVTAVIEPHKIDVLFSDRLRRLVHQRAGA